MNIIPLFLLIQLSVEYVDSTKRLDLIKYYEPTTRTLFSKQIFIEGREPIAIDYLKINDSLKYGFLLHRTNELYCNLYIFTKREFSWIEMQSFKQLSIFGPTIMDIWLNISFLSGVTIKCDNDDIYGCKTFVALDKSTNLFRIISDFEKVGSVYPYTKNIKYFYSLNVCSITNYCWVSKLYCFEEMNLICFAEMKCDSTNLITYKYSKNEKHIIDSTFYLNVKGNDRFEYISKKWNDYFMLVTKK
jgi:hypothetical protein